MKTVKDHVVDELDMESADGLLETLDMIITELIKK